MIWEGFPEEVKHGFMVNVNQLCMKEQSGVIWKGFLEEVKQVGFHGECENQPEE